MKKIISLLLIILFLITLLCSCNMSKDLTQGKIQVTDQQGYSVGFDATPTRVVVFQAALADIWLQAGGTIVGITDDYDDYGLDLPNVEIIGENHYTQDELIFNLSPDFVIYSYNNPKDLPVIEKLKKSNIKTFGADISNFNDYLYVLEQFCKLTGRDDIYKTHGTDVKAQIDNIINSVPDGNKSSYVLLRAKSKSAPTIIGKDHFVTQMLTDLKATNIAVTDANTGNLDFSMEVVVDSNPDYIFITFMGISNVSKSKTWLNDNILSLPAWKNLDAVKNGKVIYLYDENNLADAHLFQYKPNEKWAEAYSKLYEKLYNTKN